MTTLVRPVDPLAPDPAVIAEAAAVVRAEGLVAFPTETVYGLGANGLAAGAVARIFAAKGRPPNNPVIVHTWDMESARALALDWPETATRLAVRFWPGPLTLVLRKAACVPDIVTAGGATVALRVPGHPVALALLRACGVPLAAPSANRSSRLSPTRAAHVLSSLEGHIDLLLDAGSTQGGVESTVLDLTGVRPRLLRPGLVAPADLEASAGPIDRAPASDSAAPLKSPGMLERHYAPNTPLECISEDGGARVYELTRSGIRVGWLSYGPAARMIPGVRTLVLPQNPCDYAAGLYAALHELDAAGLERLVVTLPPATEEWLAIHDRLRRAAS